MFKRISTKLITLFLLVSIIPIIVVTLVSIFISSQQFEKEAINELLAVRELKLHYIQTYLHDLHLEIDALAHDIDTVELVEELQRYEASMNLSQKDGFPINTNEYKRIYDKYFTHYDEMVKDYDFHNIYIIDIEHGRIQFTWANESDAGTNLKYGKYKNTHLAKLYNNMIKTGETQMVDFEPYAPSNNEPEAFIAAPILKNGKVISIFALEIDITAINDIMHMRAGMGETGESYLIGDDYLMRSDLYLDTENHSVKASFANPEKGSIKTVAAKKAIKESEEGAEIIVGLNGHKVYSAYSPLDVKDFGFHWGIIAEIDVAEVNEPINNMILIIVIIAVIIAITVFIISIILSRSIANPLKNASTLIEDISDGKLTDEKLKVKSKDEIGTLSNSVNTMLSFLAERNILMDSIAKGDLTVAVKLASNEDEVGKSLMNMVQSLNEIVQQVNASVEQVNIGASQISDSSQTLSQGAAEQASSLEEISASMNEISSQVQTNTEGVVKVSELIVQTKDNAEGSNSQMQKLVTAMDKINQSTKDIKDIVKVIDDIAFQTNLLALNADIEAARVGRYGKGFAVVANSVRNLASKSQTSVKETTEMVEQVIKNIETGSQWVEQTAVKLDEIKIGAVEITGIAKEVAASSQEQLKGIEQISSALSQVEEVVQSNSANAEENAAGSEELSSQGTKLKELVSYFKVNGKSIGGSNYSTRLISSTTKDKSNGNETNKSTMEKTTEVVPYKDKK